MAAGPSAASAEAEYARLTAIASDPTAAPWLLALAGEEALWTAASLHAPELIEPAQAILDRVESQPSVQQEDPASYLGVCLANAFVEVHTARATTGEWDDSAIVGRVYKGLGTILNATVGNDSNSTAPSSHYLERAVCMGLVARADRPNFLVVPAPPSMRLNSVTAARHNCAVLANDQIIPANTQLRFHNNGPERQRPDVGNIYVGDFVWNTLRTRLGHTERQRLNALSNAVRKRIVIQLVGGMILEEHAGTARRATKTRLDELTQAVPGHVRQSVKLPRH